MGSRVQRQAPKDLEKKKKKANQDDGGERPLAKRKAADSGLGFGYTDIIEATQDVEGLTYRPSTAETREVFNLMVAIVHKTLGDQAQDIVRSAADTVLETLKADNMKDFDKKRDIEGVLGASLTGETFSQLLNLSKKITDYGAEDQNVVDPDMERKDAEIDDELGVAVVFEDEDEDEEDEDEGFEVREDSDDEDAEPHGEEDGPPTAEDQEEALVFGTAPSSRKAKASDDLSPHDIDGFWLQRLISTAYPDAVTATSKTSDALSILSSEANLRDVENSLMDLFDYEHFQIVKTLTKNRDVIVWCTKLARADESERMSVEVAMRERGVGWILKALRGDRTQTAADDAMDVDSKAELPKTGTIAPGASQLAPRKTVDLESMIFQQGGHLMSNKKCKLPDGSFKRSKKGYEEIHVPAPKKKPEAPGELVPITDLPVWAQAPFSGTKTLNRVQSKLFPIAFGTDEPILLCAPTGAGKVSFRMCYVYRNSLTFVGRPMLQCSQYSTSFPKPAIPIQGASISILSKSFTSRR